MSLLSIFKKMTLHAGQRGRARSHNGDRKLAHGYWPIAYVGCGLLLMVSCIYVPHSLELHQPLWRTTFIAMIKFWIKWSNVHKFTVLVNYANLWIHFSKWWYPYIRYSASITTGYWIIMVCNCQLMPAILSMWNHLPFQQVPSNPPPYLCSISGPNSMRKWQCIII